MRTQAILPCIPLPGKQKARTENDIVKNTFCISDEYRWPVHTRSYGSSDINARNIRRMAYFWRLEVCSIPSAARYAYSGKESLPINRAAQYWILPGTRNTTPTWSISINRSASSFIQLLFSAFAIYDSYFLFLFLLSAISMDYLIALFSFDMQVIVNRCHL